MTDDDLPPVRENDEVEEDRGKETDPWMPTPSELNWDNEAAEERVSLYLTQTGLDILERLVEMSGEYTKSGLLRIAFQDFAYRLTTQNPENYSAAHLNYLAGRRAERDKKVGTRVSNFKRRVDDVVSNRIDWSTHPEVVETSAENFFRENRQLYEAGFISDEVYEEFDRYVRKQFTQYDASLQKSQKRDDRRVSETMTGVKESGQFAESIEDAARAYIRFGLTGDRDHANFGDSFATEAARESGDTPPEMPHTKPNDRRWCIQRAKERAVEGNPSHGEPCLLDQAAEAYADGRERAGDKIVESCVELYPNEHDHDFSRMKERAQQRADVPRGERSTDDATTEPPETTDAVTEPAGPPTPDAGVDTPAPVAAEADGGDTVDPMWKAEGWFIEAGNQTLDDPDPSEAEDEEATRAAFSQHLVDRLSTTVSAESPDDRLKQASGFAGGRYHRDDYDTAEELLTDYIDTTFGYLLPEGEDAGDILDRAFETN